MRWLLLKDLQILRRSPLLVTLLVVYPVGVALLLGLALSRGPDRPRVAFVNEVPPGQGEVTLAGKQVDLARYAEQFFHAVDPIRAGSRAAALRDVRSGDALAALIIPADLPDRIASGVEQAQVEVVFNGDALKQSFVEATIDSQLARANLALSNKLEETALGDLRLLVDGGRLATPLGTLDLLGLRNARRIVDAAVASLPRASPSRAALGQVASFAGQALEGLGFARQGLSTVSRPIAVKRTVLNGRRAPLDAFAVAVATTVSLMLVCVLLAAGMLALEREEQAFGRLVRGLVSREALLAEKIVLAAAAGLVVGLVMLAGLAAFVHLDLGRVARWPLAVAAGALAFGALGVAVGGLAREVRAASLLALLLSLPLAFLALVPSGAVATGLYDVIRVISALFPFKPALQAVDAAVAGGTGMLAPLAHLLVLAVGFAVLARLALRRFA